MSKKKKIMFEFDSFEFKPGLTKEQFKALETLKGIKDKEEVLRYINFIFTGVYVPPIE